MIFYRAVDGDGLIHWVTVATEAKSIDPNYEQHDIGTDKASLKELLNDFQQQLHKAQHDDEGAPEPTSKLKELMRGSPHPEMEESCSEESNRAEDERLDVELLESQVAALGMVGTEGLEQFDGWQQINGISAAFSRGVHLLNIVASDDHQLALVLLRDKRKKKGFGR